MGQVSVCCGLIPKCHRNRRRKTVIDHAPRAGDGNTASELHRTRNFSQELPSARRDLFPRFPRGLVGPEYNDMGNHAATLWFSSPEMQYQDEVTGIGLRKMQLSRAQPGNAVGSVRIRMLETIRATI